MTANEPSNELTSTTTKITRGTTKVVQTEVRFFHNIKNKADTYMNYTRPPLAITFEPIKKAFLDAKNRGVHLRYLTHVWIDIMRTLFISVSDFHNIRIILAPKSIT